LKTEVLLVRQSGIRSVRVERTISIEVPSGLRNKDRIASLIGIGDLDYGPFPFQPVEGTEYLETTDICFLGAADDPADIPMGTGVGA
jgi:hypothetical protein